MRLGDGLDRGSSLGWGSSQTHHSSHAQKGSGNNTHVGLLLIARWPGYSGSMNGSPYGPYT